MPLVKSPSKKAFKENVSTEVKEGNKPIKQAVAIAYSVKREAQNRGGNRDKSMNKGKGRGR